MVHFFIFDFYPTGASAARSRLSALIPELRKSINLTIVNSIFPIPQSSSKNGDSIVYTSRLTRPIYSLFAYPLSALNNVFWFVRNQAAIKSTYFYQPYLHTTLITAFFARLYGKHVIIEMTELESLQPITNVKSKIQNVRARIEEWLYPKVAHKLVLISDTLNQVYSKKAQTSVATVVYEESFKNIRKEGAKNICYMGTFAAKDDVPFLIRSFSRIKDSIPESKLICLGDGPERAECIRLAHELGCPERILFPGAIDGTKVPQAIQTALCLIMNRNDSPYSNHGFPTKLSNYLVTEIPVVCALTESIKCRIPTDCVFGYEPNDTESFTRALVQALTDNTAIKTKTKNALKYATNHFSPKVVSTQILKVIKQND